MKNMMLQEIKGDQITFVSIYKNEFNNWNLKEEVVLTPEEVDGILLKHVTKFKIYNQKPVENHYLVKIQETKQPNDVKVHLYAVSIDNHRFFYERVLVYKFNSMELEFESAQAFDGLIEEDILKKSQFLGNWEARRVKITSQEGLTSKKAEKQKDSLHIKQTKQIWTRFELVQNAQFIVIKCKYMLGKEQFAIPTNKCGKWFKAFYSLFTAA